MAELLFYCRSGYESDLLAELDSWFAEHGQYGYAKFKKNTAIVRYSLPQANMIFDQKVNDEVKKNAFFVQQSAAFYAATPKLTSLVFARQKLLVIAELDFYDKDRISQIVDVLKLKALPVFSDVFVEYADSDEGKQMAKFCKKFVVPLRNALRKSNFLYQKPSTSKHFLHFYFDSSQSCTIALSTPHDRSTDNLGIKRLKMPHAAPSRSTLKLEEALTTFFNPKQVAAMFVEGMRAVDLGACPGGWTFQLVQRKVIVEAVDHGSIDKSLMDSGLVEYYAQDGFLYKPQQGNVDWLVCDMIEQPTRVSELVLHWLLSGQANAAIFNLKLPMNKRHKVISPILQRLKESLQQRFGNIVIKSKQLYHNRDEVTVLIIVNSQLLMSYHENIDYPNAENLISN